MRQILTYTLAFMLCFSSFTQICFADNLDDPIHKEEDIKENIEYEERISSLDGVKVTVAAKQGVFPAGWGIEISKPDIEEREKINESLKIRRGTGIAKSYNFDIRIIDKNGREIEPNGDTVKVIFELEEAKNESLEARVYHANDCLKIKELNLEQNQEKITIETSSFSIYTIDFVYTEFIYEMMGYGEIPIQSIAKKFGITEMITAVDLNGSTDVKLSEKDGKISVFAKERMRDEAILSIETQKGSYNIKLVDSGCTLIKEDNAPKNIVMLKGTSGNSKSVLSGPWLLCSLLGLLAITITARLSLKKNTEEI